MVNLFDKAARANLEWFNKPQRWEFTGQDGLLIAAPASADYYQDPAGKNISSSAPFLFTRVGVASFELTARLQVAMKEKYDSGCLMLMDDDRNWAKLCFEYNGQAAIIVSVVTKDGTSDDCNSERVLVENPYLKIQKKEKVISFFYSSDGQDWLPVRNFGMEFPAGCKAGVVAQSPLGNGCDVHFESLLLMAEPDTERPL